MAVLLLMACNTRHKDVYKGMTAAQIYAQAEKNVTKENYSQATKDFEALEARFPYGEFSDKAQLGLVYAYYKHGDPDLALSAADRFIRMHPHNQNVDYAYYLKGLVTFDQNYSFTFRYLPLDKSARDPSTAQESFEAFKELIERFPNSQYIPDAKKRMIFLRNQLANHELQVVEYYIKRGAYLSAANRANYIVEHFQQTPTIPKALAYMVECYQHLGMPELAADALKTLQSNFPESEALKKLSS
jgi:outer membrane protein assembly factor BamD